MLYFLGIFVPYDWEFLEFGVSFVEGYCIYCFFVMIAHEIGSLDELRKCIIDADVANPCFYGCQKNTPLRCFMVMRILLMQFFVLRPLLFLIIAVLEELHMMHKFVVFLGVMVLLSIIVAMITLIRAYHIFNKSMGHLMLAKKILFIKFVIFIVLIGNNVVHKYQNSGYFASGEPR
jgi:glucan phosphoethanolaminetransferase (alkaline phosphatase superfamily)